MSVNLAHLQKKQALKKSVKDFLFPFAILHADVLVCPFLRRISTCISNNLVLQKKTFTSTNPLAARPLAIGVAYLSHTAVLVVVVIIVYRYPPPLSSYWTGNGRADADHLFLRAESVSERDV